MRQLLIIINFNNYGGHILPILQVLGIDNVVLIFGKGRFREKIVLKFHRGSDPNYQYVRVLNLEN